MRISCTPLFICIIAAISWSANSPACCDEASAKADNAAESQGTKESSPAESKKVAQRERTLADRNISPESLSKYKTISVTVEENGKKNTYEGVPVRTILAEEIPAINSMPEWKQLARREIVLKFVADDGFPAIFAATEVATNVSGDRFILATICDGKPLAGGIRLICPKDEHHVRWARQIKSLQFISLEKP